MHVYNVLDILSTPSVSPCVLFYRPESCGLHVSIAMLIHLCYAVSWLDKSQWTGCVCVCLPDMQSRLGFWFAQCGSPLFISRRKDFLLALTSTKTNIDLSLQAVHRILPVAMVAYPTVWDSSHIMVWKLEPTFLSPGGIHHTYWMYQGQDSLVVRVFDFQQKDSLPLPQWCHIFQDPNTYKITRKMLTKCSSDIHSSFI